MEIIKNAAQTVKEKPEQRLRIDLIISLTFQDDFRNDNSVIFEADKKEGEADASPSQLLCRAYV
ncbi:MAG: hypothetical protein A3J24_07655 [Deltaproteobacteria bacterium RIFCSPLOWO2_02_FULL_53_8]|nr:MAG: hypothetical protein A3J24_07655 [Deltaproteobacteria bacterium RIFCSPLOWO2_02_FULL_53_8]